MPLDTPGLVVQLQPSRQLAVLLLVLHSVCALALLGTALPWFVRGIAWLMLSGSLIYNLKKYSWLSLPDSITALHWSVDSLRLALRNETTLQGQVAGDTTVWNHLLVLRVQLDGKTISLPLLPDSASADALRQLRIRLLHSRPVEQR